MMATSGSWAGTVAAAAIGGRNVSFLCAGSCAGFLVGLSYGMYTHSKTEFDVDTFLDDLWELSSLRLTPKEKLDWMSYIWKFYDLQGVLCHGSSLS